MSRFLVMGLPRSRTFWLSRFLSYRDHSCAHEQARYMRGLSDARSWLAQDCTGSSETGVARWWRLIRHLRPDIQIVVVRRPVAEVVNSLMRLDLADVLTYDRTRLTRLLEKHDRALDRVERDCPGVLSVQFRELNEEATCQAVFEHCLPYQHDHWWWWKLAPQKLECDMPALMRYVLAHRPQIDATATVCRQEMRRLINGERVRWVSPHQDGLVVQKETMATFWPDAQELMREHCRAIGEPEDQFQHKNVPLFWKFHYAGSWQIITARLNGRMLGYMVCLVGPSLEAADLTVASQMTFFASRDAAGLNLGMRLLTASIEAARKRGCGEVHLYAGVRADGPRLGVLYRRVGADNIGNLYRLRMAA